MGNSPGHSCPPIYSPPVPFRHTLPQCPANGTSVSIYGNVPPHCGRFAINIDTSSGDTALHFNPRFEQKKQVVRNSHIIGQWGPEETNGPFPFAQGHPFEVNIRLEQQKFQIAVNRTHFCDFVHRVPREACNTLVVKGDIQISQIVYQPVGIPAYPSIPNAMGCAPPAPGFGSYPMGVAPAPNMPPPYSAAVSQPIPIYNPTLPFNGPITGGSAAGKLIRITGVPDAKSSRFSINLVAGHGFERNADVNMQMDVRFNFGQFKNVVVRNHRQGGQWGQEEKDSLFGPFPFYPSQPFELILRVDRDKYCVAVNGSHMLEFRHRMKNLRKFDHLFIKGDVQINQIQFQ